MLSTVSTLLFPGWTCKQLDTDLTRSLDDSSNSAIRNLVMDHTNNTIFERNYLSRMIRYDVQAAVLRKTPQTELIRAASRMSRWMDPRRPKKLTSQQTEAIKDEQNLRDLYDLRDRLRDEIRNVYGPIHKAKGQEVYDDYVMVNRAICSQIHARKRAVIKQMQKDYDIKAPLRDIAEQRDGSDEFLKHVSPIAGTSEPTFRERSQIAKAFFCDKPVFESEDGPCERLMVISDMISLCELRERRVPRVSLKRKSTPEPSVNQNTAFPISKKRRKPARDCSEDKNSEPPASPEYYDLDANTCKQKSADAEDIKTECQPFQCLFCIGDRGLSLSERFHEYSSKYSLQRHMLRCGFKSIECYDKLNCPHPACAGTLLQNIQHFKNHAETIHKISI